MATEKQIQANRRNALRSTGPKTPQGKAAVRLNALRHGLRARGVLLPAEIPEEYHQLCDDLESEWRPKNRTEQLLVEQMAVAQWKLARFEIGERSIFIQDLPADRQLALLDRFSVHRGRLERSFSRAVRELDRLRRARAIPEQPPRNTMRHNATRTKTFPAFTWDIGAAGAVPPALVMSSPAQPDTR